MKSEKQKQSKSQEKKARRDYHVEIKKKRQTKRVQCATGGDIRGRTFSMKQNLEKQRER